jgi:hypothetical protein
MRDYSLREANNEQFDTPKPADAVGFFTPQESGQMQTAAEDDRR